MRLARKMAVATLMQLLAMAAIAAPFLTLLAALFLPLTVIPMRLPAARQCLPNMMAGFILPKVVFPT